MKNQESWKANKFIQDPKTLKWIPNINYAGIANHSYIIAYNQIKIYEDIISRHVKGRFLDCGCGDVPFYGIYKDLVSEVTCLDWPGSQQKQIHVDIFCDLNNPIPASDNSFDSILIADVLEHLPSPELLIKEVSRICNTDGKIIIMTPFFYRLHETPFDFARYTEYSYKYWADKYNLKIEEIKPYGSFIEVIFDTLNKTVFNTPRRSKILWYFYKTISKNKKLSSLNLSRENDFPLGYCVVFKKCR